MEHRAQPAAERALLLLVAVGMGLGWVLGLEPAAAGVAAAIWFGGCLLAAHAVGATAVRPLATFALLSGVLFALLPAGTWPLPPVLALVVVVATTPAAQRAAWLRRGRTERQVWVGVAMLGVLAPTVLWAWYVTVGDVSGNVDAAATLLRATPWWALPLLGVAFAALNVAVEELVYRGILQSALAAAFGVRTALVGQAVVFGLTHVEGFPSGASGALLATAYGLALGWLRHVSGGLFAPWAAHVAADLAIFALVVIFIR